MVLWAVPRLLFSLRLWGSVAGPCAHPETFDSSCLEQVLKSHTWPIRGETAQEL